MIFSRIAALFRRSDEQKVADSLIGIAWYSERQWPLLREVSVDGQRLEKTFEEWRQMAQQRFDDLERQGRGVVKVQVDVEDLVLWCKELGRPVDAESRVSYIKNRIAQVKLGNIAKL